MLDFKFPLLSRMEGHEICSSVAVHAVTPLWHPEAAMEWLIKQLFFIFVGGSTCNRGYMPQRVQSQSYYIFGISWCAVGNVET
jgi:hypothetical protein